MGPINKRHQRYYRGDLNGELFGQNPFRVYTYQHGQGWRELDSSIARVWWTVWFEGSPWRWGARATENSEAKLGAQKLAFVLLYDATGQDLYRSMRHYAALAKALIEQLDDYWMLSAHDILEALDEIEVHLCTGEL